MRNTQIVFDGLKFGNMLKIIGIKKDNKLVKQCVYCDLENDFKSIIEPIKTFDHGIETIIYIRKPIELYFKSAHEILCNYLEFDVESIYNLDAYIFGGSIRDIIAHGEIKNDVDLICLSKALKMCDVILKHNGYVKDEYMCARDLLALYNLNLIHEPHTYRKGTKIVQLINPVFRYPTAQMHTSIIDLISNVDIDACGVYFKNGSIHEATNYAQFYCESKLITVNQNNKMFNINRIQYRIQKLINRDWIYAESYNF